MESPTPILGTSRPTEVNRPGVLGVFNDLEITHNVGHLLHLPYEIRDQIYTYALSSPTGYVGLEEPTWSESLRAANLSLPRRFEIFPWNPRYNKREETEDGKGYPRIVLSLLRVCKQVSAECKDIFWQQNICYLDADRWTYPESISGWPEATRSRIQHIVMKFDVGHNYLGQRECPSVETLKGLGDWSSPGSLKSVTLVILNNTLPAIMNHISEKRKYYGHKEESGIYGIYYGNEVYPEYLSMLREGRKALSHLERNLVVYDDGVNLFPNREVLREILRTFELHPVEMFLQINAAFGGKMWLNGEFCYKDGKMVKMPFELDRVDPKQTEPDSGDETSESGPD
jgi:hypothetical protein